jgi:hypothetical protein
MNPRPEIRRGGLCVAVGAALLVASPVAWAQPAPPSLGVDLDIAEQVRGGGRESVLLTMTLAGDRGCSSVQVRREHVRYDVQVCREGGDAGAPVLSFAIERSESSPRGHSQAKFRVTSRMAPGKRAVIGRVAHADGAGTHVTAVVR